ncbi:vacuolar protein sorting-associated protein 37A-like [Diaphorina citri]|uniref:Vacuolar protein sorting-associated protein 37A-like n=1 Tax=Diaphorina citri TaxID=121845 RepID=A0A3Q0JEF0_DIACI|nr:vacuolar protein sorting-associated protein 37A-like [Diaphorina citri]
MSFFPSFFQEQLLKTVNIHEEESERIADNFLENKIDLDTFLGTYIDKRVVTHRLRAKEERLSFQLEALEKASY